MTIFESILIASKAMPSFFEAAGTVVKIISSLWITNFNQVKLVQILDTTCSVM